MTTTFDEIPEDEIPEDAKIYYARVEREVIDELTTGNDAILSEITLKQFVSYSKGRGRKRAKLKEVELIKYGHEYHQPHRFNWWVAGLELLGDIEDVETKLRERVLGNQAFNMNSLVGKTLCTGPTLKV